MRIVQVMPTISYGDAVSNSAVELMKILQKNGIHTSIYAENIHPKMNGVALPFEKIIPSQWDVVIYHLSTGSKIAEQLLKWKVRKKWMIYHNVTPSEYFEGYNQSAVNLTKEGREQIEILRESITLAFADSDYNRIELEHLNYSNVVTLPIVINFKDYNDIQINAEIIRKFNDDWTNILFVGRIAPNKKQEDIIKTFYYYKKYINPKSRLFLVGSFSGMERYYTYLYRLVEELDLSDVFFSGHIPLQDIISYYHVADTFLCMSEHEGFCVPLLEAFYFQIPVLAYGSSAIPETLGNAAIQINEKNFLEVAAMIDYVMTHKEFKNRLIKRQLDRLEIFNPQKIEEKFINVISEELSS